jgi:hypothetical protein
MPRRVSRLSEKPSGRDKLFVQVMFVEGGIAAARQGDDAGARGFWARGWVGCGWREPAPPRCLAGKAL